MNGTWEFISGLALLIAGAELVVRGASRLALALGIRPLVLGLTVIAVGTSAPELVVGITASLQGSGALAVGNIAGTNIFNILFILGLSAALKALPLHLQVLRLEMPVTLVAAGLLMALAWDGLLTRLDGCLLFAVAIVYTTILVRNSGKETGAVRREFKDVFDVDGRLGKEDSAASPWKNGVILCGGLLLLVLGAHLLVDGAVDIARKLHVSEAMIGLTIVAVGTSAPELITTIVATLRNERDVAIGNLIGSSIYNILVILGITCIASPGGVPVEQQLLWIDIPLMSAVMIACVLVFVTGRCISRMEGSLFVGIYLVYMTTLILLRT